MRKLMLTLAAIGATLPAVGHALGLGEIRVNSALNEPLNAEVDILAARPGEVEELIVSLADAETFRRAGLERPFVLTKLRFEIERRPGGQPYVKIFTRESVREPFLSFLVEADWAKGRVIREFTILLDPPMAAVEQPQPSAARSAAAPEPQPGPEPLPMAEAEPEPQRAPGMAPAEPAAQVAVSPELEPHAAAETTVPSEQAVAMAVPEAEPTHEGPPSFDSEATRFPLIPIGDSEQRASAAPSYDAPAYAEDEYGPVVENQTLWSIAQETRSDDVSMAQMMLAYLRANPEAFIDGNINRMRKGYVLRVPSRGEATAVGQTEALAEVEAQNGLWREYVARVTGETYPQAAGAPETVAPVQAAVEDEEKLTLLAPKEEGQGEGASGTDEAGAAEELRDKLALSEESLEAARVENEELRERIGMLEEQVGKMQRLIELKQDELAELQMMQRQEGAGEPAEPFAEASEPFEERLAEARPEEGPVDSEAPMEAESQIEEVEAPIEPIELAEQAPVEETVSAETTEAVAEVAAGESVPAEPTADTEMAESQDMAEPLAMAEAEGPVEAPGTQVEQTGEPESAPVVAAAEETPQESPGFVQQYLPFLSGLMPAGGGSMLGSPVTMGAAVGVPLVLLLGGGLFYMRRRQDSETETAEAGALSFEDTGDLGDESEDTGLSALPDEGPDMTTLQDITDITAPGGDFTKTELGEEAESTSAADDKDDTVSEVDVYLAYGLHQQAEDLLRDVIKENPDRKDLRLKLLETHYAAKNEDAFVTDAEGLKSLIGDSDSQTWDRVLAMGAELAPDHALFSGTDASKLEAPAVEHAKLDQTDIGLDEDDTLTRATDVELEDAFSEASDLSMTQSLDLDEIGALPEGEDSGGLEADLGNLDSTQTEILPEGGTPKDDASGLEFDLGEIGDLGGGEESDLVKTADETPSFEPESVPEPEDSSDELESTMMALPDFDLPGEQDSSGVSEAEVDADLTEVDLAEPGLDETVALSGGDNGDDLALPDDVDEVGTKLDLAKAFIDMGDSDGARGTLEEVLAEGNDEQKAEAQRLMQQIA